MSVDDHAELFFKYGDCVILTGTKFKGLTGLVVGLVGEIPPGMWRVDLFVRKAVVVRGDEMRKTKPSYKYTNCGYCGKQFNENGKPESWTFCSVKCAKDYAKFEKESDEELPRWLI